MYLLEIEHAWLWIMKTIYLRPKVADNRER